MANIKMFPDKLGSLSNYSLTSLKNLAIHGPMSEPEMMIKFHMPYFDFIQLIAFLDYDSTEKEGHVRWKVKDKYRAELILRK